MSNPMPLSRMSIDAHQAWVERGRTGAGRIDEQGVHLSGARMTTRQVTGIRLVDCTLNNVQLLQVGFREAELTRCQFSASDLEDMCLEDATLRDCTFTDTRLLGVSLSRAKVVGCRFSGCQIARSFWLGAKVVDCQFDNARLARTFMDQAVFEDCSFRGTVWTGAQPNVWRQLNSEQSRV